MHNSLPLVQHSRFVQRIHRRYGQELHCLPMGLPTKKSIEATFNQLCQQTHTSEQALRIVRHVVLERLIDLDCTAQASLQDVTACMTTLAEFALETAYNLACTALDARYGKPLKDDGERVNFWIIGMGKLGARELNVSSDIDLIYVYETDGVTSGATKGSISCAEYFQHLVKRLYTMLGDTTEHGFVFRIDLALRPNGLSGAPIIALAALEQYFQIQGREWERFAWLKSRVIAPKSAIYNRSILQLRQVVLPFVFRRYLDYNVFEALRVLHDQIRAHANQRSATKFQRTNDVKISRGGIREVEFTVQLLQVVRGGQFPELRVRPTLKALECLQQAHLMTSIQVQTLSEAYIFLRQVEHRIQYLDDQQTHILPEDANDLQWIAHTMGYPNVADFSAGLQNHREQVAHEFDTLLQRETHPSTTAIPQHHISCIYNAFDALLAGDAQHYSQVQQRLENWRDNTRIAAMRPQAQQRLLQVIQLSIQWLHSAQYSSAIDTAMAATAVLRLMDWLETVLRRESYVALLLERPTAHYRLLEILAQARWSAVYLIRNPSVVDELAQSNLLHARFDAHAFINNLTMRLQAAQDSDEADEEVQLNLLRQAMHAHTFRILARDVAGQLTVEQVADDLSALADSVLQLAVRWCWQQLLPKAKTMLDFDPTQHDIAEHFAVVAYGKLGGLELGYGGDLDLVFLYADASARAGEFYATLVRKLVMWLTTKTGEGDLYEIDTALRPNGNAGLLTTNLDAFESYQLQRGSNTAWVWEHQAMTRARCCFGSTSLQQRFENIRIAVITAPRENVALRQEIIAMRQRVAQAHCIPSNRFNLKHSTGGMIDAEFVTQYLVLQHAAQHPSMLENRGNIALLERADDLGLLSAAKGLGYAAAHAYRSLRKHQHNARLNDLGNFIAHDAVAKEATAIKALWQATLG